jgi:drug/metabolite transporter (DMT)-like permease
MPDASASSAAPGRALGFVACALASAFWGCGFFFGKIALAEMNVGAMVFYRFAFAVLGLLPLLFTHRAALNRREWGALAIAAFLGIPVQFLLQFYGLSLTTVSHAALMVGTMPVILAVGATVFAHERLHRTGWVALVISTGGAALIALGGGRQQHAHNGPSLAGDLCVVVSMLIALSWLLINKRLIARHSPVVISAWGTLLGWGMLFACVPPLWGLPPVHGISWKAWLALAASGLLCTAATTLLWNWGMTRVPASQGGVLLNAEPLMGSVLGVLVLHERLSGLAYVGGAMIVAAAVTLTVTSSHPAAGTEEQEIATPPFG